MDNNTVESLLEKAKIFLENTLRKITYLILERLLIYLN